MTWPVSRCLRRDELIQIWDADDPHVTSGQFNVYGFTPAGWRAYERRLAAQEARQMASRLFNVGKVGLFLDDYGPGTEKRGDELISVVTLALRVQPLSAKLAAAMPEGVRTTLYQQNKAEPRDVITRAGLELGVPPQNLEVFSAPDIDKARIMFHQAKIAGCYARTEKGQKGFALCFKATFGPVGPSDLGFIHAWYLTQRFVTFQAAEPGTYDEPASNGSDGHEDTEDEPTIPGTEGTCSHGVRMGQQCDECDAELRPTTPSRGRKKR